MANFTLDQESYEALIALAQRGTYKPDGTIDQQQAMVLDTFLQSIEKANGITRYSLWVRWMDPTAPLPPGVNFPKVWPVSLQYLLQFISRPVSKTDVLALVAQKTPNAMTVMVTPDPAALLGWTALDAFFTQP
jgi:hypothetical protein